MKSNKNNKILLEKYINALIQEAIIKEDLEGAFIDPIADIFKTVSHSIQNIGIRLGSTIKTLINGLPTLFTPFMKVDFESIEKEEEEQLDKLKAKYQDVFDRTESTFVGTDLGPMAFLINPEVFLGISLVKKTPQAGVVALTTLQALTGGTSDIVNGALDKWRKLFRMDKPAHDLPTNYKPQTGDGDSWGGYSTGGAGGGFGLDSGLGDYGAYLEEALAQQNSEAQLNAQMWAEIQNLVSDKTLLNKSPVVQQMSSDILEVFVLHVSKFMSMKTLDDLMSIFGDKIGKLHGDVDIAIKHAKTQEEVEKIKQTTLASLKSMYKTFYIDKIKNLVVSQPHLANAATKAISQIQAMH